MTIWVLPAAVLFIGAILVAVRSWAAWHQAQALSRSLVSLRALTPDLEALRAERATLAAELQRITRR